MADASCRQKIVVIVGPTASGKSELALRLAARMNGEIVNADSMQCYRGMTIGTARPSAEAMAQVPHHLYGIVSPDVNFTAANFIEAATAVIADIGARGKLPLVVGGTGLYIRALLGGLTDSPAGDDVYRRSLESFAEEHGLPALHQRLAAVDPAAAARLHVNDRVRVIRALEVFQQSGRPFSAMQQQHGFAESRFTAFKIGVEVERELLYQRIEQRVDAMLAAGLVAEVRELLAQGYAPTLKSMRAIGYREICSFLADEYPLAMAVELIKRNTRRYAKRQLTWFKADREINWVEYPSGFATIHKIMNEFVAGGNADDQGTV